MTKDDESRGFLPTREKPLIPCSRDDASPRLTLIPELVDLYRSSKTRFEVGFIDDSKECLMQVLTQTFFDEVSWEVREVTTLKY